MPQMQGLVGVGRGIFDNHGLGILRFGIAGLAQRVQMLDPIGIAHRKVQKAFHGIESRYVGAVSLQIFADHPARFFGAFLGRLDKGKHHQGDVAFKFPVGFLELYAAFFGFKPEQFLDGLRGEPFQNAFDGFHVS